MSDLVFVDTNVLLYDRDARDRAKHEAAARWLEHLWEERTGRLSFQVLSEFYVAVTRKLDPGLRPDEAREHVRLFLAWHPIPVDEPVLESALALQDTCKLSFWDSVIVAAARLGGCRFVLTEDLQDGQDLAGVIVVDPFRHAPSDFA